MQEAQEPLMPELIVCGLRLKASSWSVASKFLALASTSAALVACASPWFFTLDERESIPQETANIAWATVLSTLTAPVFLALAYYGVHFNSAIIVGLFVTAYVPYLYWLGTAFDALFDEYNRWESRGDSYDLVHLVIFALAALFHCIAMMYGCLMLRQICKGEARESLMPELVLFGLRLTATSWSLVLKFLAFTLTSAVLLSCTPGLRHPLEVFFVPAVILAAGVVALAYFGIKMNNAFLLGLFVTAYLPILLASGFISALPFLGLSQDLNEDSEDPFGPSFRTLRIWDDSSLIVPSVVPLLFHGTAMVYGCLLIVRICKGEALCIVGESLLVPGLAAPGLLQSQAWRENQISLQEPPGTTAPLS